MNWSEESRPAFMVSDYNHITMKTPMGEDCFIEWSGKKEPLLHPNGENLYRAKMGYTIIGYADTLDEIKEIVKNYFTAIRDGLNQMLEE